MNLELLEKTILTEGAHDRREDGVCAMELVAWMAGEPHGDRPKCACPVISTFVRTWNDSLPTDADRGRLLKPLLPPIIGSKSTPTVEQRRGLMAADWIMRTFVPTWLDAFGNRYATHTAVLRAAPEINSWDSLATAMPVLIAAKKEAARAWASVRNTVAMNAARVAGVGAVGSAALTAASDAFAAVAGAAATSAARTNVSSVAGAAVRDAPAGDVSLADKAADWSDVFDAALAKFRPLVLSLQESASSMVRGLLKIR